MCLRWSMANLSLDEAISKIDGILDRVALEAQAYMKESIRTKADNPTGALEKSIDIRNIGSNARGIGSSLSYAKFANDGRGPVRVKNKKYLHWVYPRPNGQDFFAKEVGPAEGLHFIEDTAEHLRNTQFGLM